MKPKDLRMRATCEAIVDLHPPWLDELAERAGVDQLDQLVELACGVVADVLDALDIADERPDVQAEETR